MTEPNPVLRAAQENGPIASIQMEQRGQEVRVDVEIDEDKSILTDGRLTHRVTFEIVNPAAGDDHGDRGGVAYQEQVVQVHTGSGRRFPYVPYVDHVAHQAVHDRGYIIEEESPRLDPEDLP